MGLTAFVTGVGGQDGSYLAERLVADGYDVHALVREEDGPPPYCPDEVVQHLGDVTDVAHLSGLLGEVAPREVYNLAGLSSVAQSWRQPAATAEVNGAAVASLLETTRQVQERTGERVSFVQASSGEMFGNPARTPQDETTPLRPVNPYGASKAYAHLLTGVYRGQGVHACSVILYNHESPRRPRHFVTRKITATVADIVRGKAEELVLGNLDARRDWGWAPDYVDAMVRAARADEASDFVVATGEGHSVRDFVAAAFARAGVDDWEGLVRTDPEFFRPADAVDLTGDASRARERLGWRPTVTFEELVGRMVDHDLEVPWTSSGTGSTGSGTGAIGPSTGSGTGSTGSGTDSTGAGAGD